MIQTEGITKSFGSLQVLKGIDLTIGEGEIVAIVGPSGAGKTTLLQIIGTLDAPDSGKLYINGTETVRLSEEKLAAFRNRNIGFVLVPSASPGVHGFGERDDPGTDRQGEIGRGRDARERDARLPETHRSNGPQARRTNRRRETARSRCPRPHQQPVRNPRRRTIRKSGYQEQGRVARTLFRVEGPDEPDVRNRNA